MVLREMSFAGWHYPRPRRGFTLVEMLVAVAIVITLGAVTTMVASSALASARTAREVAAAKNLIGAYQAYASDHGGRYLPGMDMGARNVIRGDGRVVTPPHVGHRYPYRLAPYFDYRMEGTILVNDNGGQVEGMAPKTSGMYDYMVSAFPALGINYYMVGGLMLTSGQVQWPSECLTRSGASSHSLLVFASGGTTDGSTKVDGYNVLTPPNLTAPIWSGAEWNEESMPNDYGNVDARHAGRAVCAFLDGSVQLLSIEDLRDMRLWSRNAARRQNPDYQIK